MLTSKTLETLPNVGHGFFTRLGGHSSGIYASLNCGYGSRDDKELVRRNRAVCADHLGVEPECLLTLNQQHTADVVTVTDTWLPKDAPVADGLVADRPEVALAVLTADCVPVLFADSGSGVVGAAHAGWKGARIGVIEATVKAMTALGADPETTHAAIGPCIGADSYEIGPEFKARFVEADIQNDLYFTNSTKDGHSFFDLQMYVRDRLTGAGINLIDQIGVDTCREEDMFFSYRRSCLRHEPDFGRQLSGIVWT